MTNQQFIDYLEYRLDILHKMMEEAKDAKITTKYYQDQESLLTSALKIMRHASGPERRRFRRDYERRLGL